MDVRGRPTSDRPVHSSLCACVLFLAPPYAIGNPEHFPKRQGDLGTEECETIEQSQAHPPRAIKPPNLSIFCPGLFCDRINQKKLSASLVDLSNSTWAARDCDHGRHSHPSYLLRCSKGKSTQ
jgi:hypothetical protein